jgi:hypothetical protein
MITCQQKAHPAADTCRPERQEFPRPQTFKRLSVQHLATTHNLTFTCKCYSGMQASAMPNMSAA